MLVRLIRDCTEHVCSFFSFFYTEVVEVSPECCWTGIAKVWYRVMGAIALHIVADGVVFACPQKIRGLDICMSALKNSSCLMSFTCIGVGRFLYQVVCSISSCLNVFVAAASCLIFPALIHSVLTEDRSGINSIFTHSPCSKLQACTYSTPCRISCRQLVPPW
jgi:hypothetical protein